jgi:hypothetical protein
MGCIPRVLSFSSLNHKYFPLEIIKILLNKKVC